MYRYSGEGQKEGVATMLAATEARSFMPYCDQQVYNRSINQFIKLVNKYMFTGGV